MKKKMKKEKKEKRKKKGRGEVGKGEGTGEETKLAAFIFTLYFASLPSQSWWAQLPVYLWTPSCSRSWQQADYAIKRRGLLRSVQTGPRGQVLANQWEPTLGSPPAWGDPRKALYCMSSQRPHFLMPGLTRKGQRLPSVHCLFCLTC